MASPVKHPQFFSAERNTPEDHSTPERSLPHEGAGALLIVEEAAGYLRVSKSYLDKLRVYGGGPKFLRPGKRKILYRKSDLDVWAAERTFTSTSEYEDLATDQSECRSNNEKEHPTNSLP
jgi:excisionase family DNA binding protein